MHWQVGLTLFESPRGGSILIHVLHMHDMTRIRDRWKEKNPDVVDLWKDVLMKQGHLHSFSHVSINSLKEMFFGSLGKDNHALNMEINEVPSLMVTKECNGVHSYGQALYKLVSWYIWGSLFHLSRCYYHSVLFLLMMALQGDQLLESYME